MGWIRYVVILLFVVGILALAGAKDIENFTRQVLQRRETGNATLSTADPGAPSDRAVEHRETRAIVRQPPPRASVRQLPFTAAPGHVVTSISQLEPNAGPGYHFSVMRQGHERAPVEVYCWPGQRLTFITKNNYYGYRPEGTIIPYNYRLGVLNRGRYRTPRLRYPWNDHRVGPDMILRFVRPGAPCGEADWCEPLDTLEAAPLSFRTYSRRPRQSVWHTLYYDGIQIDIDPVALRPFLRLCDLA